MTRSSSRLRCKRRGLYPSCTARRMAGTAAHLVEGVDVLAQVQADAAATWRLPQNGKPTVRGVDRLRAWCEGFSLHAGVVIADHDREALERLCRLCGALHKRQYAHRQLMQTRRSPGPPER